MNPMEKLYNTLKANGVISSELSYEDYCKQKEKPIEPIKNLGGSFPATIKEKKLLFEDTLTGQEREDFLEAFGPFEE